MVLDNKIVQYLKWGTAVDAHMNVRDADEMVFIDPSETRTKESNICASIWVANPDAQ